MKILCYSNCCVPNLEMNQNKGPRLLVFPRAHQVSGSAARLGPTPDGGPGLYGSVRVRPDGVGRSSQTSLPTSAHSPAHPVHSAFRRGPQHRGIRPTNSAAAPPIQPPAMGCSPEAAAAACPDCLERLVRSDLGGTGLSFVHGLSDSPLPFAASAVVQVRPGFSICALISGRFSPTRAPKLVAGLLFGSVRPACCFAAEFVKPPLFACINPCLVWKSCWL
jgi:hypothetical protein